MSHWEGIGGPVSVAKVNFDDIDPTLDSCCQRELQDNRKYNALQATLQKFDIVAEKERRRRNLVKTELFDGCRCCYDPNADGGEYEALRILRASKQQEQQSTEAATNETEIESKLTNKDDNDSNDEIDSDDEFDYLLEEDLPEQSDQVKAYDARRKMELELRLLDSEWNVQHGFGVHRQFHPLRVLKAAHLNQPKPDTHVVLHLFDPDSQVCADLDWYLEGLAQDYPGTKFMRANGRQTLLMDQQLSATALPGVKHDRDLPCLLAIQDGSVRQFCPRLVGLKGEGSSIVRDAVYRWLDQSGALIKELPSNPCNVRPEEDALMDSLAAIKRPDEPRFDCGNPLCSKSFYHEHVGEPNDLYCGLVVSEEAVVGEAKP